MPGKPTVPSIRSRAGFAFAMALVLTALPAPSARAEGAEGRDVLLSAPYALKAGLPLLLAPAALAEPGLRPLTGALLAAFTLPNSMLLYNLYSGDPEGTRRWRKAVFWIDAGLGTAAAGAGAGLLAAGLMGYGSQEDELVAAGSAFLGLYAAPLLGMSLLDRIAFRKETPTPLRPTLGLAPGQGDPAAGKRPPALLAGTDILLSTPYALKAALPLFLVPEAVMDGDALPLAAVLMAAITLPNVMVLQNLYSGDGEGTGFWRRFAFWSEIGVATACLGTGLYLISREDSGEGPASGYDNIIGFAYIALLAMPIYAASLLDRIPFKLESEPARLTVGMSLSPHAGVPAAPGLAVRLHIPI
jgi:hypothetical protein